MNGRCGRTVGALLLFLVLLCEAQAEPVSPDRVSLDFSNADLVQVIRILAQHLNLDTTIHPEVQGTVTIHAAEPLKREDLLPIFHQVLVMNGAEAVKTGEAYQILPINGARGPGLSLRQQREEGRALHVVPVRFFTVGEMKRILSAFATPVGEILDYAPGRFLIIAEIPSNIRRMIVMKDLVDVEVFAGTRMEIFEPRVASAEELAQEMAKVVQAEGFVAYFLPLFQLNRLMIISTSAAAWDYAGKWLGRMDAARGGSGRKPFIYPIEDGKASDMAEKLKATGSPLPVVPDAATNTLIVFGTAQEFQNLKNSLEQRGAEEFRLRLATVASDIDQARKAASAGYRP